MLRNLWNDDCGFGLLTAEFMFVFTILVLGIITGLVAVRQALIYLSNGDAEAALVSKSLAHADGVRVVDLDPRLYDPLIQALGIVADPTNPDQARAIVQSGMRA